jgi:hypothetical protein
VDSAQERKAANEAIFREVNEQVVDLQTVFAADHHAPLTLVCECHRLGCAELVQVEVETYELVREDGAAFIVVSGHEDPAVEEVVESGDGFVVVRKRAGEPREIALETNPRS